MTRLSGHVDRRPASGGFTLVEMLVSLAVLALALTVIGVVFTVATETTRQAAAYSEVQNWLRQFTAQIEEDLKYCEPSNGVLVLVGRMQPAALTQADLDAGKYYRVLVGDPSAVGGFDPEFDPGADPVTNQYSDPRADILMFFTNRSAVSQAPPPDPTEGTVGEAALRGSKFSPIQVVYGHAAFDEATWNGNNYVFADSLRHIEQPAASSYHSIIPAGRWHLSRRATIIAPVSTSYVATGPVNSFFSVPARQRIVRCEAGAGYTQSPMPGDMAHLNLGNLAELFGPDSDYYIGGDPAPRLRPYDFDTGAWPGPLRTSINSLLYGNGSPTNHHVATVVQNPPPDLRSNLGVHMLPGCAWFQVEFLMPEDPRNSLDYNDPTPQITGDYATRFDMPRWTEVNADANAGSTTYVFVPDTAASRDLVASQDPNTEGFRIGDFGLLVPPAAGGANTVANRRIRMWPYAIRITVRVFDPLGRLEQPIVRSIVHRFD